MKNRRFFLRMPSLALIGFVSAALVAQAGNPAQFNVDPESDHIWGHAWPAFAGLNVTIGDPAAPDWDGAVHADERGDFHLDAWDFDIQAGHQVTVTDGDIVKEHIVTSLTITEVDPDTDTVSGTAEPHSWVTVWVFDDPVYRDVQAGEHGHWMADFSVDAGGHGGGTYNLVAGTDGNASQRDGDGDGTFAHWRVDRPQFTVNPQRGHLWGHDWPVGAELTVTIGDPAAPDWEGTTHAGEWGDFHLSVRNFDIQAGHLVTVTDGDIVKEHIVTSLTITDVNPDADTISGTAEPHSWVHVWVHDEHVNRDVQADEQGHWTVDFSQAAGGHGGATYNLEAGSDGGAGQWDEDGDETLANWYVPDPVIVVELYYNNVRGRGWPSGTEVGVAIGDPAAPDYVETVHADARGDWWVHLHDDHVLQPGDVITADGGTVQRSTTVADLSVTGADPDANTLSGTGPANAYVLVRVGEVTMEALATPVGEWTADLGAEGVDLQEGTRGELFFYDGQRNATQTRWHYATLNIHELSLLKLSADEGDLHIFGLDVDAYGLLGARFQAPSGDWYAVTYDYDDWWVFNRFSSSMADIDAEFGPGEYLLELTHYHGVTEVTLEVSADMEMPNATPDVTAPEARRSDVDPVDVEIAWEGVEDRNFNAIYVGVEDELFGWESEEDWYEAFLPIEDGVPTPTRHMIGELKPDRLYLADVAFVNADERQYSGAIEVDYTVMYATMGGTVFSTNTDETLFDPIQRVEIRRGLGGGATWLLEFEIQFGEALQPPGESPLYRRLELWTPEDAYYTLFDSHDQNQFGGRVAFEIERDDLDDLPGGGWYALIVRKDDASAVATWFLFAEPESEEPLPMPEQTPVITRPLPGAVVANPVTFAWEPVTDETVNAVAVSHAPHGFALLEADAVEYRPPEDLPIGPQGVGVTFARAHLDLGNADAIPYGIVQFRNVGTPFTVGHIRMNPSGGEVLDTRRPEFTWTATEGAAWHQLVLHRNGAAHLAQWVEAANHWTPGADLPAGVYQWWVRGWGPELGHGTWSGAADFTVPWQQPTSAPTQTGPTGEITDTRRPVIAWEAVEHATWYRVHVQRVGSEAVLDQWTQDTELTPPSDLTAGTYRWWVVGWGPDGFGPWSDAMEFTIPSQVPGEIVLIGPQGEQADHDLTYRWELDANATWYRLWVGREGVGTWHDSWYNLTGAGDAAVELASHPAGTFTWWLRPWGPDGYGLWVGPVEFTTPSQDPTAPELLAPTWEVFENPPLFAWRAERSDYYRVYVQHAGVGTVIDDWTQDPYLTPEEALPAGQYAWWVGAWNEVTRRVIWSPRGDFMIDALR